jgi:CHRD domain
MRSRGRRGALLLGSLGLLALLALPATAWAKEKEQGQGQGQGQFGAVLTGFQEVPAISTRGRGEFRARLRDNSTLEFELRYSDLEGGNPSAAHTHLGQRGVNGGVVAFLCGGGGKPACPPSTSGTVTGTIVAADIQAVPAQGIAGSADFAEVVAALRAGVTYVNVHNSTYPNGEIRGQIGRGNGKADDHKGDDD